MSIPRGSHAAWGSQRAASPPSVPGRAPRWEAAAAEVISCAWPRAARRARCGHSGRGAAASAGAGFVRSSRTFQAPASARHAHRDPCGGEAETRRPLWHSRRATAGHRRAWRPGSRQDSRQLTQVSRAGREGRGCAAGRGHSAGRTGLTPCGREGNSGAGASPPGSRGTGAGNRELLDARTGSGGCPSRSSLAVWDRLDPVAPGKAPRDVRAGFLPPRCSPLNPSAPLRRHSS